MCTCFPYRLCVVLSMTSAVFRCVVIKGECGSARAAITSAAPADAVGARAHPHSNRLNGYWGTLKMLLQESEQSFKIGLRYFM